MQGLATGPRGRLRRSLARALGPRRLPRRAGLLLALGLWTLGFAIRALHAYDLAPVMYSHDQPATRMAARYHEAARAYVSGDGVLYPRTWPVPSDTGLLARPPGYPLFMAAVLDTLGETYYDVQLVQCALGGLLPVAMLFFTTRLVGCHAALVSAVLAAADARLAYYSSVVTPDGLGVLLTVLVLALLCARTWRPGRHLLAAGLVLGATTWMRPNFLLLGPFLAAFWLWLTPRRRGALPWALGLAGAAAAVVAPITVRNLRIYGELVPVSINAGIVLWEGIADAGGERYGARSVDWEVAAEEAERYHDLRYARWWASPDGIWRDHERMRRSLAVIRAEPLWFLSAALARAAQIVDYRDGGARFVAVDSRPAATPARHAEGSSAWLLFAVARVASLLRLAVGPVQRALVWTSLPLALCGLAALGLLCPRRLALLLAVPVYHVVTQAPLHYEPRYVLPMHPFVLVLVAAGMLALFEVLRAARRRARA